MAVLNRITDLGIIQYTNAEGDQNQGFLYVDTNQVMQFQTNNYGSSPLDEQTCTIITGSLPPVSGSSSVSALLEIQSSTGGLLISRLSQDEIEALVQVVNGFIVYNTTTNQFQFFQNGAWNSLPSRAPVGDVTGPTTSGVGNLTIFNNTTGTLINDSGINISNNFLSMPANPQGASAEFAGTVYLNGTAKVGSYPSLGLSVAYNTVVGGVIYANGGLQKPWAQNYGYLDSSGAGTGGSGGSSASFSIFSVGAIQASSVFVLSSINAKNIITEENIESEVIELFKKLQIVKYQYKDKVKEGSGEHYGVIAEEVAKVLPYVVNDLKEFAPNIMTKGIIEKLDNKTKITFSCDLTEFLEGTYDKKELKIFVRENESFELKISNIGSDYIEVELLENKLDHLEEVFVYGTKESCPAVAKERIFEMNIAVTQNLMKRIEQLEMKIGV